MYLDIKQIGICIMDVASGNSSITQLGVYLPEGRKDVKSGVESLPDKKHEQLKLERYGIRTVSSCGALETPVEMALKAVANLTVVGECVSDEGLGQIDTVIYCGICREAIEPSTAAYVAKELRLNTPFCFDITNACIGFSDAWIIADALVANGTSRRCLLVGAENYNKLRNSVKERIRQVEDVRTLSAGLTLGDGAFAAVVEATQDSSVGSLSLLNYSRLTYPEYADLCVWKGADDPVFTRSSELMASALKGIPQSLDLVLTSVGWTIEDVDRFVFHQVSAAMNKKGAEALGIPVEKIEEYVETVGNLTTCGVPSSMLSSLKGLASTERSRIVSLGLGSGLNISVMAIST